MMAFTEHNTKSHKTKSFACDRLNNTTITTSHTSSMILLRLLKFSSYTVELWVTGDGVYFAATICCDCGRTVKSVAYWWITLMTHRTKRSSKKHVEGGDLDSCWFPTSRRYAKPKSDCYQAQAKNSAAKCAMVTAQQVIFRRTVSDISLPCALARRQGYITNLL
jgi:hypothetical protein